FPTNLKSKPKKQDEQYFQLKEDNILTADKWAIGIDLGGTKIKAARVDKNGTIQDQIKESTAVSGGVEAVQKQIEGLAHKLIRKSSGKAVSLGIGVAGQIDKET